MRLSRFAALAGIMAALTLTTHGQPDTPKDKKAEHGPGPSDLAKRLVGTWELTKTDDKSVLARTIEFTSDGKQKIVLTAVDLAQVTVTGTYEVEGDLYYFRPSILGKLAKDKGPPARIRKLTDDVLHLEFGQVKKVVDEYKRKMK